MTTSPQLVLNRYGRAARIIGTILLAAAVPLAFVFAELAFRDTDLRCEPPVAGAAAQCSLVEQWPGVRARVTPLPPVTNARTRVHTNRRGSDSVALLLEHADRTVSEHLGVGARGDRAETTVMKIRDHLEGGRQSETFELRQGNVGAGVAVFAFFMSMPLLLLPGLFAKVRFVGGPSPIVRVGRGLLPARQLTWTRDDPARVVIRPRIVNGTEDHALYMERGTTLFDLGVSRMDPVASQALAAEIDCVLNEG